MHLSPPHEVRDSPGAAAHCDIVRRKLGDSSVTRHLAGLGVKIVYLSHKTIVTFYSLNVSVDGTEDYLRQTDRGFMYRAYSTFAGNRTCVRSSVL
jgi:hypothetical protein